MKQENSLNKSMMSCSYACWRMKLGWWY